MSKLKLLIADSALAQPWFMPHWTQYFAKWAWRRSSRNLWDYAVTREHRPYYHITDDHVHRDVARYYAGWIHAQA